MTNLPFSTDEASYDAAKTALEAANTPCARAAIAAMGEKHPYHKGVSSIDDFSGTGPRPGAAAPELSCRRRRPCRTRGAHTGTRIVTVIQVCLDSIFCNLMCLVIFSMTNQHLIVITKCNWGQLHRKKEAKNCCE